MKKGFELAYRHNGNIPIPWKTMQPLRKTRQFHVHVGRLQDGVIDKNKNSIDQDGVMDKNKNRIGFQ